MGPPIIVRIMAADVRKGSNSQEKYRPNAATLPMRYPRIWAVAIAFVDLVAFSLAIYIGASLVEHRWTFYASRVQAFETSIVVVGVWFAVFGLLGMYRVSLAPAPRDELYFSTVAIIYGLIPLLLCRIINPAWSASWVALLFAAGAAIVLVGSLRVAVHSFYSRTLSCVDYRSLSLETPLKISLPTARLVKRLFDLVGASAILLVCSPILLIACLLLMVDSGTPILFVQERIGLYGRPFCMYKLRTMKQNAGLEWARPGDDRITKFGSFLRRTSIDELPQLLNVLRGEMSLVGPRPEMTAFEAKFAAEIDSYTTRRVALPGLTGWAQVNVQRVLTPADVEQVLQNDIFYVEHWSLFLDLTIILKTAVEFMFHRPA